MGGFSEAVVDHVGGNVHAGFRRDKHNPPPTALDHARRVGPGNTHARHHVGFEEALPFAVRRLEKVFQFEDAQVVDDDIEAWVFGDQCLAARRVAQIANKAVGP
ncbi:hypothetical protein D3C84_846010 [compost metagenome]